MSKAKRQKGAITPAFVLQALAVFVVGSFIGVSLFTIIYAKGYSYLGNDPKACINRDFRFLRGFRSSEPRPH